MPHRARRRPRSELERASARARTRHRRGSVGAQPRSPARARPSSRARGRASRSAPTTASRQRRRAALEQQRVADAEHALGRQRGQVARRMSPRAPARCSESALQLVQPETPERDQQLVAPHAPEAGEREALEQPLEAPLRAPRAVARERDRLQPRRSGRAGRSRLRRAPPTGGRRSSVSAPARRVVGGARAERDALADRAALRPRPAVAAPAPSAMRIPANGSSPSSGREVGDQEAHPGRALEIAAGQLARLAVEAGRRPAPSASRRPSEKAISCARRARVRARRAAPGTSSER